MADVTLRLVKGSPLTYQEVDDNFNNLNDSTGHFKNRLINGNFDFWQRGTSSSLTGSTVTFVADRWLGQAGTSGVATVSRQDFTLGQTDVPGEPEFFFRHNQTTAATGTHTVIGQNVESVRTFAGQTMTWSIWAKVGSGTKSLVPRVIQAFGTGGTPSSSVLTSLSAITVTTSWQRFSLTFNVPSISGKTIGTNRDDFLRIDLIEDSSFSTFALDFAQAQLEKGSQATEFEYRPFQTELALCQRYFFKTFLQDVAPASSAGTGGAVVYSAANSGVSTHVAANVYPSAMRAAPSLTFFNPGAAGTNWRNASLGANSGAPSTTSGGDRSVGIVNPQVAGDNTGNIIIVHLTADAEL